MADFKGKPVELNAAPEVVFARLSDLSNLNEKLEELPAEMREAIGEVRFTPDSIIINAAPAGEMTLAITERIEPSRIVLSAGLTGTSGHDHQHCPGQPEDRW